MDSASPSWESPATAYACRCKLLAVRSVPALAPHLRFAVARQTPTRSTTALHHFAKNSAATRRVPDLLQAVRQVLRYDVAEVRPVSLRDIRLAERERDRDARQLQQQAHPEPGIQN